MSIHWLLPRSVFVLVALTQAGCHSPFQKETSPVARPVVGAHVAPPFQDNKLSPKQSAQACITTAEKLAAAGHRREAIGLYQRARQHHPKAIDYSRRLAVLYDQSGDMANALSEYRQAIDGDPDNADLLNDFGYFHFTQGDFAAAEENFRQAISLDQNHQRAWTNLGIVLAHQTRYQEAFDAFARIVGPAAAHSNIGAVMAKQGRMQQSQLSFRQALAMNPNLKQPQAFLAYYSEATSPRGSAPSTIPTSFTDSEQR